ncbi:MAG: hypothetical protein N4A36_00680 [Candidatus Gracilibacteria bacterium]|nr:hypothetical protein [Candidatus Gracilibacteria bacterium]
MTHENKKQELLKNMAQDEVLRRAITKESHYWFFHMYFSDYITCPTADFQKKIIDLTENDESLVIIQAFRGSGKSTIVSMSYPIWAILGKQQKKFVVIFSRTQKQAKLIFSNLKAELEHNKLLAHNLGPFREESNEWNSSTIVLPKHNARIMISSNEQGIRGIKHRATRPDLLICDDIEDLDSVRTQDGRDKIFNWLSGDVFNLGDQITTKMVIVGNLLHRDAVLNRFKEKIESGEKDGSFHEFPLVKDGVILWPRKFKTMADIEALRRKVADEATFQREFMLYLMPTCEQVIFKEWMKYIDNIPEGAVLKEILLSMDLAVSESQKADYTTIVTGMIFTLDGEEFLFIHPYPINEKLTFPETVSKIQELYNRPGSENQKQTVLIEEVGYQKALTQQLRSECPDMNIEPVSPKGDKRARLALSGQAIRSGKVWFPTFGIKDLENQILDFGVEKHDDLADAFSQMVIYFSERNKKMGTVTIELLRF